MTAATKKAPKAKAPALDPRLEEIRAEAAKAVGRFSPETPGEAGVGMLLHADVSNPEILRGAHALLVRQVADVLDTCGYVEQQPAGLVQLIKRYLSTAHHCEFEDGGWRDYSVRPSRELSPSKQSAEPSPGDLASLRLRAKALKAAGLDGLPARAAELLLAMEPGEHHVARAAHEQLVSHAIESLCIYGGIDDAMQATLTSCYLYFDANHLPPTSRPEPAPVEAAKPSEPAKKPAQPASAPDRSQQLTPDEHRRRAKVGALEVEALAVLLYDSIWSTPEKDWQSDYREHLLNAVRVLRERATATAAHAWEGSV